MSALRSPGWRSAQLADDPDFGAAESLLKRSLDLALAVPLLVVLLPMLGLLALAVMIDSPGPPIFRQERVGLRGRAFRIWKFRSMYQDAADALHRDVARRWFGAERPEARSFKPAHDPRVTRVGRVLRRTSLDELPQLWNVVAGDMSLVGPRPGLAYELELYEGWHFDRQRVRPGITGLWQVCGRDSLPAPRMMELDVRYVREWSLGLDLRILLRTPAAVTGRYAAF